MHIKSKIWAGGLALVLGAIVLLGVGCANKETNAPASAPKAGESTGGITAPTTDTSASKSAASWSSDKDRCVELMAYTSWMSLLAQRQDIAAIQALQKKTGEDLTKYFGWNSYEDMQKTCVPIAAQKGFMELMAKRMKELGFTAK